MIDEDSIVNKTKRNIQKRNQSSRKMATTLNKSKERKRATVQSRKKITTRRGDDYLITVLNPATTRKRVTITTKLRISLQ